MKNNFILPFIMYNIFIMLKINKFITWISIIISLSSFAVVFFFSPSTFIEFFRIELFDIFPNSVSINYEKTVMLSPESSGFTVRGGKTYGYPEIKEYLILGHLILLLSIMLSILLLLRDYTKKIWMNSLTRWFIALYFLFFILSFIDFYLYLPSIEIVKLQINEEYFKLFYAIFMWILFSLVSFFAVFITTYHMASSFRFKKFFYSLGFFLMLFTILFLSHRILFYGIADTIGTTYLQLILTSFVIIIEFVLLNIYLFLKKSYKKDIIKQGIGTIVLQSLIICMLFVPIISFTSGLRIDENAYSVPLNI